MVSQKKGAVCSNGFNSSKIPQKWKKMGLNKTAPFLGHCRSDKTKQKYSSYLGWVATGTSFKEGYFFGAFSILLKIKLE